MKKCAKCKELKLLSAFGKRSVESDGLHTRCKVCHNAYQRMYNKRPHVQDYISAGNLKRNTGLTVHEFEQLLLEQKGKCAICKKTPRSKKFKRLHVDHNHQTGIIRGLLCSACNTALGLLKENPLVIERALKYLRRGGQIK